MNSSSLSKLKSDIAEEASAPLSDKTLALWGEALGRLSYRAMMEEVLLTPKPGLVDRQNSGSHRDMDSRSFARSARAVADGLPEFVYLGYAQGNVPAAQALPSLRAPGMACERAMYRATGGVNTHKGAVFAFGLLCAAAGRLLARGVPIEAQALCQEVADVCRGMVMRELASVKEARTAGERFYLSYGFTGARGEAESGFATALDYGLPAYRESLRQGWSSERSLHQALLTLMAHNDDTNLVSRGGVEGLRFARNEARALLNDGGMAHPQAKARLAALDDAFIAKNLSPGGSADLLAVTWFLAHLPKSVS
ncbi:triphosphoribosyl-dephospho-CoA synthase CitG [Leminorella grimontii]|uniref:triphosphoribosyl-dephospho-CoA synthase CitG n=1 Tax=Leminorella grimontii TaxID=82981 RepID=UPI002084CED8|nr:triphosphoribosyl-dephospho-CoA synthase CitG [Leminorella grimontii]GKX58685.1 putative 2-(5''-triphosphoribosyl)-3'-dephosphocoenzyme-A synthase [Leminorella grimontii]